MALGSRDLIWGIDVNRNRSTLIRVITIAIVALLVLLFVANLALTRPG